MLNLIASLFVLLSPSVIAPAAAVIYECGKASAGKKIVFVIRGEPCAIPVQPLTPKGVVVQLQQHGNPYSLHLTQMTTESARATLYRDAKYAVLRGTLIACRGGNDRIIWTEAVEVEYGGNMNADMSALCADQQKARQEYLKERQRR